MPWRGKGVCVRATSGPASCLEELRTLNNHSHWKRHQVVEMCVVLCDYAKGIQELSPRAMRATSVVGYWLPDGEASH